jgi:hypothetical protein
MITHLFNKDNSIFLNELFFIFLSKKFVEGESNPYPLEGKPLKFEIQNSE